MHAKKPIYLDYAATTPPDKAVIDAMTQYLRNDWGNPSSAHTHGKRAHAAVEKARLSMASLIGCRHEEIFWTSGATESNNLALRGVAQAYTGRHIVTCVTEHKSVLATCDCLEKFGYKVTRLPVDENGQIDPDQLWDSISDETSIVSMMAANNETGTLHDLVTIGQICRDKGVFFHVDGAQAVGKIGLNVEALGINLLSISGHKFYGPKGVGAIYVKGGEHTVLETQISGGGQECNVRSGTLNVPAIVGAGRAAELAAARMKVDADHCERLRELMLARFHKELGPDGAVETAPHAPKLPGTLHVSFPGAQSKDMLAALDGKVSLSSGSACSAGCDKPSYVISAMGYSNEHATCSLRISIGRRTTTIGIQRAVGHIIKAVDAAR